MGYRHYLYAVPKKQVEEIQACKTNEDWCNFAESYGYKADRDCCDDGSGWFSPYKIGTELYELGKYSEIGFKLESERPSLFTSKELKERYSDYGFALLTKEDFKAVIEAYRQKIIAWLESLLNPNESRIDSNKLSKEERKRLEWEYEIRDKLDAWSGKCFGISPIDLDESRERITGDWSYEYAIFELVRLYKIFDWENDDLVLAGW
jgi:hypothetical protein